MTRLIKDKKADFLIFLCWAAYTSAYVARLNYNASMVEILAQLSVTKQTAGAVSSFFFFSYGAGQLINGLLVRKYNTRYSVAVSLLLSCVINFMMTLCTDTAMMKYLWFFNGACQSVLWSSLIKTLSDRLSDSKLPRAIMVMSTTVASGTFLSYGLAAVFSAMKMKWTLIFYVASVITGAVAVLWYFGMKMVGQPERNTDAPTAAKRSSLKLTPIFIVGVAAILVSAVANGFVKDGVTTWVPSILKEEFGVPSSLSIIVTLLLPVLSIFGTSLVNLLHKKEKNENALNAYFYLASAALSGAIILTLGIRSVALTLILFGGIAFFMSAINNVITSIVPLYSRNMLDSGLCAGLLNTFCYVGSTLSTSLLGLIADKNGWNDVFRCILIFTCISFVCCLFAAVISKRKTKEKKKAVS